MMIAKRAAIGAVYLFGVNLLAGWAAVTFRYPSLWGNSDVFAEYAVPLPLGWALDHWLSMTPLTLAIFAMPKWSGVQIRQFRFLLIGVLLTAVMLEFIMGGGRWHRVPFLLFPIIDASTALGLTFLRSRRALRISFAIAFAGAIAAVLLPSLIDDIRSSQRDAQLERVRSDDGWFQSRGVTSDGLQTIYRLELETGADERSLDELCYDALSAYEQMLEIREPDDRTDPVIQFIRSESSPRAIGEARYSARGRWLCEIELAR